MQLASALRVASDSIDYNDGMSSDLEQSDLDSTAWQLLQRDLDDVAQTAKRGDSFREMSAELLRKIVEMLAADGGAIWLCEGKDDFLLQAQVNTTHSPDVPTAGGSLQVLRLARRTGEFQHLDVADGASNGRGDTAAHCLIAQPIKIEHDVVGLLEIVQQPLENTSAIRGHQRLLSMIAELVSDRLKLQRLHELRGVQGRLYRFQRLADYLHGSVDFRTTAFRIVNAGREYLGCDRISLAIRRGTSCRLEAMSNVATIDRRSASVRSLEKLAKQVIALGEPLCYAGRIHEVPDEVSQLLTEYLDVAHVRQLNVVPLRDNDDDSATTPPDGEVFGALIVEDFDAASAATVPADLNDLQRVAQRAMANAIASRSTPLVSFFRQRFWDRTSSMLKLIAIGMLLSGIAAFLCWYPGDFDVHTEGELQPVATQHVFAPFDSEVVQLLVVEGQEVQEGDSLIELRSATLDFDRQALQGELDTARKRLYSLESTLLDTPAGTDKQTTLQLQRLAAEHEELKRKLSGMEHEMALLDEQQQQLRVTSPLNGHVLTWNLEQNLRQRPVQRGQLLLSVGDLDSTWMVELKVPDDRIGYVLSEAKRNAELPTVEFETVAMRGQSFRGRVQQIATRMELDESHKPYTKVTVAFDQSPGLEFRPGATVRARIHCGTQPLGYVLFHDFIEAIRRWLTF